MGCNQSKVRFSQVFKRKRATKRTTWYVDLGTLECSPPLMQHTSQKPAPASNIHYEDFSILSFMTRKDHYEWVEMYAKEQLLECLESCLNYKGFHEYGFHLLSLSPRPLLEIRTYDNRSIHSLPWGNSTALEYFLRLMVNCHRSFPRSESKTVLDSGFHAMDSGFQIVDFGAFVSGIWIPDSNRWRDSVSCIPDPKARDSRFHKQKCSLHEAQLGKNIYCPNKVTRCSNSGIRKKIASPLLLPPLYYTAGPPRLEVRRRYRASERKSGCSPVLFLFIHRTIPEAIEAKVGNDPFVLVIDDLDNESGYSKMCVSLIEKTCQTLQMRFEGRLKRVCINRPYGLLAYDLAIRKRFNLPFASCEIENKLIVADRFSVGKLARATGFPGRLIPEDELKTRVASL
ncbi:unnamed protein product [Porites lobata]|uniref:Uncharacterized protein n=1 Tax=Porites lobata TaxID=104759 RepID=A0ABN8PTM9_9CNID|nr:unnamed protein product [Porites lobata]